MEVELEALGLVVLGAAERQQVQVYAAEMALCASRPVHQPLRFLPGRSRYLSHVGLSFVMFRHTTVRPVPTLLQPLHRSDPD
jgi:hypothetical protein